MPVSASGTKDLKSNAATRAKTTAASKSYGGINTSTVKTSSLGSRNSYGASEKNNNYGGINTSTIKTSDRGSTNAFGSTGGLLGSLRNSMPGNSNRELNYGGLLGGGDAFTNQMRQRLQASAQREAALRANRSLLPAQGQPYGAFENPVENLTRAEYDRVNPMAPQATGTAQGGLAPPVGGSGAYLANRAMQQPQPQNNGMFTRPLSDSQLGNPMASPNTLGYRAAVKGSEAMGGAPQTQIDNTLKALGLSDVQRAGILGRTAVESNYFDPKVLAADRKFDKGRSTGLAQWRDDRLAGVKDFAGSIDSPLSSPAAQAAAIINEMQTKEKKAYGMLNSAKTLPEAMGAMNRYERQQGWNTASPLGQKEAMAFGESYLGSRPEVMTASISPISGQPAQQPQAETPGFWDSLYQKGAEAANYIDQNLVQPTKEQVAKYGGFERAGKLAQAAVSIMNFLPGGKIDNSKYGTEAQRTMGEKQNRNQNTAAAPTAAPVAPPVTPPAQQMQPWLYPQYSQQWAGLPTGVGGYSRG